MKLVVKKGYKNCEKHLVIVDVKTLPADVAPDMVCNDLTTFPKKGEKLFLGNSFAHLYPDDVVVWQASEEEIQQYS